MLLVFFERIALALFIWFVEKSVEAKAPKAQSGS